MKLRTSLRIPLVGTDKFKIMTFENLFEFNMEQILLGGKTQTLSAAQGRHPLKIVYGFKKSF